jgi:hypothetical protein
MNLPFFPGRMKEWPCPRCTLVNPRARSTCAACSTPYSKPEDGQKKRKGNAGATPNQIPEVANFPGRSPRETSCVGALVSLLTNQTLLGTVLCAH